MEDKRLLAVVQMVKNECKSHDICSEECSYYEKDYFPKQPEDMSDEELVKTLTNIAAKCKGQGKCGQQCAFCITDHDAYKCRIVDGQVTLVEEC